MKYLLVEDKGPQEKLLLDNIAEFLWNNGNEIYVRTNMDNEIDYKNILKSCDSIVFLVFKGCPVESFFARVKKMVQEDPDLENSLNEKIILVFSIDGVYCSAIPFPHKIFDFEKLCQHELTRFFLWCEKLKVLR